MEQQIQPKLIDEDKEAKIEDLLTFVAEIATSDVLVKDAHQKLALNADQPKKGSKKGLEKKLSSNSEKN